MKHAALPLLWLAMNVGLAAEGSDLDALPDLQEAPIDAQEGEQLEPDVTIIRRGRETIEEYRVNGQLYMVKVTPRWGFPYYFMDMDGDGVLDTRAPGLPGGSMLPQWILFSW